MSLEQRIKKIELVVNLVNNNDISKLQKIKSIVSPEGILDRHFYDKMPDWLATIYESGAQYYFNSSCLFGYIHKSKGTLHDYDKTFQESIFYLKQLREFIKDEIPNVIGHTPASINIEKFF